MFVWRAVPNVCPHFTLFDGCYFREENWKCLASYFSVCGAFWPIYQTQAVQKNGGGKIKSVGQVIRRFSRVPVCGCRLTADWQCHVFKWTDDASLCQSMVLSSEKLLREILLTVSKMLIHFSSPGICCISGKHNSQDPWFMDVTPPNLLRKSLSKCCHRKCFVMAISNHWNC